MATDSTLPLDLPQPPPRPTAEQPAIAAMPAATSSTSTRAKPSMWSRNKELIIGALVVLALLWGAWVSRAIVDVKGAGSPFVKVQLQGMIADYIRAQARSGSPPERVAAETDAFMKTLDGEVKALAASGQVVLVNEAVVGGDVRDVTEALRRAVYAKVAAPRAAAGAPSIETQMREYMARGGQGAASQVTGPSVAPAPSGANGGSSGY